jgi:hypothetical protein
MATIGTSENFGRSFTAIPVPAGEPGLHSRPRRNAIGDVRGVVVRTVTSARATGRDYMGQSRAAAAAVMAVRPDLTFGEALDAVIRLREMDTF